MLTTTASYLSIVNNLTQTQASTAAEPAVQNAGAYYLANIGKVTSIDDFVNNYQLFSYAMKAFGLEDMTYAKGLMTKVLEGGVTDSNALANTLSDPRFKAFATAFDFTGKGVSTVVGSAAATTDVTSKYVEATLEDNVGKTNQGVKLALYFKRNAPSVTNVYGILADSALLKVVQTAYGIPAASGTADIDIQANTISKFLNVSDLQNPNLLDQLIQRFTASWDAANNTGGLAIAPLIGGTSATIGTDLLTSLQGLKLGGN